MEKPDRPTGADAAHFAKHTQDLPEWGRLTPAEAADLLESATGRPTDYGTNAEAITAMAERVKAMGLQKEKLLEAMDNLASSAMSRHELDSALRTLNSELDSATRSLTHYRSQAKQQN